MVLLIGAERACIGGSMGGRAAAEEWARRHCGLAVLVEEIGIGSLGELQWIVGVLFALRIEDGEQWWTLPTVSWGCGAGPVCGGDRSRENWMEKKCANAKACTKGLGRRSGFRRRCVHAQAGAGAPAARVAAVAELRQELCDVEDARAGQHGIGRATARQRSDAWNIGR
jgi:hypothetical protein